LGADIVFIDEFGYSFSEAVASTWAPRGQTPVIKRITTLRRELSTMVGLSISGHIYKRHFKGSIKAPEVVAGLAHIHRHVRRPMIVIWDRSRAHRSAFVKTFLDHHPTILIEELPPYAPDLNPEEACHGTVKQRLRNFNPDTVAHIRQQLDKEFAKLRKQPQTLLGFFHHAGLSLKQLW
jgi:transposase